MLARQIRWSTLVAVVAVAAACADGSVAPTSESAEVLPGGAPRLKIIIERMAEDSSSADFTVTSSGGFFRMGKHGIVFPKNAICDPATSRYDRGSWDAPCRSLRVQDGREWVDFSPELRFKPSRDPSNWVWIYMRTPAAARGDESLNILWSPAIGVPGSDESLDDPSLRTYVTREGAYAYRRIKHFSGYNVTAGRSTSDSAEEGEIQREAPEY
jgi:hypothetical protein